jgi:hypothetical protein
MPKKPSTETIEQKIREADRVLGQCRRLGVDPVAELKKAIEQAERKKQEQASCKRA